MAQREHSVLDPGTGLVVNSDLAGYPLPADLGVAACRRSGSTGPKGIGGIGIVGTAAAVANAAWHPTGVRVRDLPGPGLPKLTRSAK